MAVEKIQRRQFFRRAIKVGNSAGVLLPKSLLGAEVIVRIVNPPLNLKREALKNLEPIIEEILGVYLIKSEGQIPEILAISTNVLKSIQKQKYKINIIPLVVIKKSIKEKKQVAEKIVKAQTIINKSLLFELKKHARI